MKKEYGYSLKGVRLMVEKSGNRFNKRITVIGALLNRRRLIAPIWFNGNTDAVAFNQWIGEHLLLELKVRGKENMVIVMDNASFHKSERTRELIEEAGHRLLYLPPYSPDFNPIEQKWGHIKNMVKKVKDKFNDFYDALDYVLCC